MKPIYKAAQILSKILEILHWAFIAVMLVLLVCSFTAPDWLSGVLHEGTSDLGSTVSTYNFEITVLDAAGHVSLPALRCFFLGAAPILGLMAMICRNVHLILKKSKETTPFQKDNIRLLREIGIFSISIPAVSLVLGWVIRPILGPAYQEIYADLDGLVVGLLVLCLTQFFAHGVELERDVDGLV